MDVLILGATARAAAWSARRAGLAPCAADRFTDTDLAAVAHCVRAGDPFPESLREIAESFRPAPWLYTGPLENHPALVQAIAARRPLWGNDAAAIRRARDPLFVASTLHEAGHPALDVRVEEPTGLPRDGSWLRKPLASAGGIGIERYVGQDHPTGSGWYYQEHVIGADYSAVYVGTGAAARLVGVTEQHIGIDGFPFHYRGNSGPIRLGPERLELLASLGDALARRIGLVGLFGVDFVVDADDRPRVVELNPRYTASVEVLELGYHVPLLDAHRRACRDEPPPGLPRIDQPPRRFLTKSVVYATRRGPVELRGPVPRWDASDPWKIPELADLPVETQPFEPGAPAFTTIALSRPPTSIL